MKTRIILLLSFICAPLTLFANASTELDVTVVKLAPASVEAQPGVVELEIPAGKIIGCQENELRIFRGIPYAEAPVGERRFAPPVPKARWDSPRDCRRYSPWSAQYRFPGIIPNTSEDALTLNVWTPAKSAEDKLPVYVYIHGGGYSAGSGNHPLIEGSNLAKRGIVVVTVNYRLGFLGFHASQTTYDAYGTTGNWGLLDQIEALKWVQKNIASFGGDPNHVTIGGESAGSFSVSALIMSPLAKGLFSQAIMESGCILSLPSAAVFSRGELKKSIALGSQYLNLLGADDTPEGLAYARTVPAEDFVSTTKFSILMLTAANGAAFWPALDGYVLPYSPTKALANGEFNRVKLMVGFNTHEGSEFTPADVNEQDYCSMLRNVFGRSADKAIKRYPVPDCNDDPDAVFKACSRLYGAALISAAQVPFADALAKHGCPVYFYRFDFRNPTEAPDSLHGVAHASELEYVFGNMLPNHPSAKVMSEKMINTWAAFIKTGEPVSPNGQKWDKYDPENRRDYRLGDTFESEPLFEEQLFLDVSEYLNIP